MSRILFGFYAALTACALSLVAMASTPAAAQDLQRLRESYQGACEMARTHEEVRRQKWNNVVQNFLRDPTLRAESVSEAAYERYLLNTDLAELEFEAADMAWQLQREICNNRRNAYVQALTQRVLDAVLTPPPRPEPVAQVPTRETRNGRPTRQTVRNGRPAKPPTRTTRRPQRQPVQTTRRPPAGQPQPGGSTIDPAAAAIMMGIIGGAVGQAIGTQRRPPTFTVPSPGGGHRNPYTGQWHRGPN